MTNWEFSLLAQVLAEMIDDKLLCGDRKQRRDDKQHEWLSTAHAVSLRRRPAASRRRRARYCVRGDAPTFQLPRSSRTTLIFLRGVLQLWRRLGWAKCVSSLDKADRLPHGVVSIMPEASLRTLDSEKDRVLKGSGLKAALLVRDWRMDREERNACVGHGSCRSQHQKWRSKRRPSS